MLSVTRYFAVVVVIVAGFIISVQGGFRHGSGVCMEPPIGTWKVEHHLQVYPAVYDKRYQSVLVFDKAFDNVFEGTMNITDRLGELNGHAVFSGVFELDSCMMTGSIVRYDINSTDTFKWQYNLNTMEGEYITSSDKSLIYPRYSRHVATFHE